MNSSKKRLKVLFQQPAYDKLLTNQKFVAQDGYIYCKFTQQLTNLPFNSEKLFVYKKGTQKYVFLANGKTNGNSKRFINRNILLPAENL